ncbi:isochorismatase superfamily hydrolase [Streptomyces viridochromogenes DSM 40736]|uniref:Isochorismatase superfamily hydrolase n=1 Tax=Streptomyces viridochromogenes (strain DSM 40736 / JCM 4977 / BCRC 1201 / Tue 494) TaxID=591159 RepID=D9XDM8_STRVT|nr:hydrolase [Streptomyces viridochromogenes]EFL30407.1 isochorismatase superfamily hydrolase [Streptomyces viridochromogenes DSM 40736]
MVDIAEVTAAPSPDLLTPDNCAVLFVDHQPQMFFGTGSGDRTAIINSTVGLARAARAFDVPVVLSTVAAESFSGPLLPQLAEVFPEHKAVDRTSMNAWEDVNFVEAVKATGREKLVIAGLWTEVCVVLPALSALAQGYEVYVVTDASGGVSPQAHEHAIQRMIQAGAVPVTWVQVLLELQRDWARSDTYDAVTDVVTRYGGAYGLGILYAHAVIGGHAAG